MDNETSTMENEFAGARIKVSAAVAATQLTG